MITKAAKSLRNEDVINAFKNSYGVDADVELLPKKYHADNSYFVRKERRDKFSKEVSSSIPREDQDARVRKFLKVLGTNNQKHLIVTNDNRPDYLAHELGHASNADDKILGTLQNIHLGRTPKWAYGLGLGAELLGTGLGNKSLRVAGLATRLSSSVPELAEEAAASYKADKVLNELGSAGHRAELAKAYGTYLRNHLVAQTVPFLATRLLNKK